MRPQLDPCTMAGFERVEALRLTKTKLEELRLLISRLDGYCDALIDEMVEL